MDSRAWLVRLEAFGIKLGLETIRLITAALDHPERACPVVHVAGTNGKGSVTAMVAHALTAAGHRTARYTSPHLIRLEERFVVDGEPLAPAAIDAALEQVRQAVTRLQHTGALGVEPTYFEATTAAAFAAFRTAGARVAVIEVGLGGRFDATNIVSPVVTAITSIAVDHEQQLGARVDAIAAEKAGIIKPGAPVVSGRMPPEAARVIEQVARQRGVPLARPADVSWVEMAEGIATAVFTTPTGVYGPLPLALRGRHQLDNAAIAIRVLELLQDRGITVSPDAMAAGLTDVRWPGRLDLVGRPPRQVLVDGAHNPAGVAALVAYLQELWPGGLPVVFGAMRDKPLSDMLALLLPVARPLVVTQAPGSRAASPEVLLDRARSIVGPGQTLAVKDVAEALAVAWTHAPTIAAAGSLYLVGEVLQSIEGRNGAADPC